MKQALLTTPPPWLSPVPGTNEIVVACHCMLTRNLSDFIYPPCCTDDERRASEARVVRELRNAEGMPDGQYFSVVDMGGAVLRFLAERRLITCEMVTASGPRGVFVSADQALTVMVNTTDHLVIRAITADARPGDAWAAANRADEALERRLDFAFHERLGYLTSALRQVGTGMTLSTLLHLPALALLGRLEAIAREMEEKRFFLRGVTTGEPRAADSASQVIVSTISAEVEAPQAQCLYLDVLGAMQRSVPHTEGNLYVLSNQNTLGVSESELVFRMEQVMQDLISAEDEARETLKREHRNVLLDSMGRALGIARGARLLGMREALLLASLIRLASAMGLVVGYDCAALNLTLVECQQAHLHLLNDIPADGVALSGERARLFRSLFSHAEIN